MSGFLSAGLFDAIPDSVDLHAHYDWSDSSTTTSTVPDLTGNGHDLTGGFTSLNVSINGVQAGEFDGVDDYLDVAFNNISQPLTYFIVVKMNNTTDGQGIFDAEDSTMTNRQQFHVRGSNSTLSFFAGESIDGDIVETDNNIHTILSNGTNSVLRENGTQTASGNVGTDPLDGLRVGSRSDEVNFADMHIGELLIYPQDKTGIFSDVENYLSDKWGIAV